MAESVRAALVRAATALSATSDTARLDAELLMAHALDVPRDAMLLGRLDDGSEEGVITRDLFLEAVVLADNAAGLLRRVWPVLVAQDVGLAQHADQLIVLHHGTTRDPIDPQDIQNFRKRHIGRGGFQCSRHHLADLQVI